MGGGEWEEGSGRRGVGGSEWEEESEIRGVRGGEREDGSGRREWEEGVGGGSERRGREWEEKSGRRGEGGNFTVTNLRLLHSLHVRDVLPGSSFYAFIGVRESLGTRQCTPLFCHVIMSRKRGCLIYTIMNREKVICYQLEFGK